MKPFSSFFFTKENSLKKENPHEMNFFLQKGSKKKKDIKQNQSYMYICIFKIYLNNNESPGLISIRFKSFKEVGL